MAPRRGRYVGDRDNASRSSVPMPGNVRCSRRYLIALSIDAHSHLAQRPGRSARREDEQRAVFATRDLFCAIAVARSAREARRISSSASTPRLNIEARTVPRAISPIRSPWIVPTPRVDHAFYKDDCRRELPAGLLSFSRCHQALVHAQWQNRQFPLRSNVRGIARPNWINTSGQRSIRDVTIGNTSRRSGRPPAPVSPGW